MPSLQKIIDNTKKQAISEIRYTSRTVSNVPQNIAQGISRVTQNTAREAIDNTLGRASRGVKNAATTLENNVVSAYSSAIHGDIIGAVSKLSGTPDAILGQLGKTFGNLNSKLSGALNPFGISNPFSSSAMSASNGIQPGDALAGALARADPVLSYNWYAEMPVITSLDGSRAELPWYYVEEATPPFRTLEVKSIFRRGHNEHFPGTYSIDALRLGMFTDQSNAVLDYLMTWQGAILKPIGIKNMDETGLYGRPRGAKGYKKNISIFLISNNKQAIAKLTYIGCWPSSLDAYALTSTGSERIITNVTFSVDDVVVEVFNRSPASITEAMNKISGGFAGVLPNLQSLSDFTSNITGDAISSLLG